LGFYVLGDHSDDVLENYIKFILPLYVVPIFLLIIAMVFYTAEINEFFPKQTLAV